MTWLALYCSILMGQTPDLSTEFKTLSKASKVSDFQPRLVKALGHLPNPYQREYAQLLKPFEVPPPVITVLNKNEALFSIGSFGMTLRFALDSFVINGRLIYIDWSRSHKEFQKEILHAIERKFTYSPLIPKAHADKQNSIRIFTNLTQAFAVLVSANTYCNELLANTQSCGNLQKVDHPPFVKNHDRILSLIEKAKGVESQKAACKTYGHELKKKALTCAVDKGYKMALELARRFASGKYKKNRKAMRERILSLMDNIMEAHLLNGGKASSLRFPKITRPGSQEK